MWSYAGPITIGSWRRTQANSVLTTTHYHWVLTQVPRQGRPSARSRHVARESLAIKPQRHMALRFNPSQGQVAQAPGVPMWGRKLAPA